MNKSIIQLKRLFEETITTLSIAEPLIIQTEHSYRRYAVQNNFDTVVFRKETSNELYCWDRKARSKSHPIRQKDVITDSTPLLDVVRLIVKHKRLFVLERNQISSIVTISDLEKMPVRIWLFGIISLTEMELKNVICSVLSDTEAIQKLSEGRRRKVEELFHLKLSTNTELRKVDCFQYCDLESVIKKSPEVQSKFIKKYRKSDFDILSEAEKLRNMISHAQKIEMDWEKILQITSLLEELLNNINYDAV